MTSGLSYRELDDSKYHQFQTLLLRTKEGNSSGIFSSQR